MTDEPNEKTVEELAQTFATIDSVAALGSTVMLAELVLAKAFIDAGVISKTAIVKTFEIAASHYPPGSAARDYLSKAAQELDKIGDLPLTKITELLN